MKSFNFETPDEAVIGRLIGAKGERVRTLREMLRSVSNYTPANEVWGEGILVSPCPSVCPSVCLTPICGHDFVHAYSRKRVHNFS